MVTSNDRPQCWITQVQAAAAELGVSARTFQDWEYGRALPQKRYRARLADWLDAREPNAA